MRPAAELLFEEFAASWGRGEHPDARDYLDRAGDERDDLAALIDGFLAAAPVQPPSEETLATFAELVPGERETPPMLAMRLAMRLRRREVVRQLCAALGLRADQEPKVDRYYHELETGILDPRRVSSRVWHALATILSPSLRSQVVSRHEPPPAVVAAFYRRADFVVSADAAAVPAAAPEPDRAAEPDEVDELFTGGAHGRGCA
ncbi:MAG TPA: hypothetical protein VNJ53_13245 [Gaiellaceae bacterium]|nr:hypothetical protein [Gaiellaceae bacterium]